MARLGMDVDAVENASRTLKQRAQEINQLVSQLDGVVNNLPSIWDGQDAQTFVTDWWPQHKRALMSASTNIDGLGQSAWNNAQEQRQVSGH